jgi:hypothetical protein
MRQERIGPPDAADLVDLGAADPAHRDAHENLMPLGLGHVEVLHQERLVLLHQDRGFHRGPHRRLRLVGMVLEPPESVPGSAYTHAGT